MLAERIIIKSTSPLPCEFPIFAADWKRSTCVRERVEKDKKYKKYKKYKKQKEESQTREDGKIK
jgi:hypothetical protein